MPSFEHVLAGVVVVTVVAGPSLSAASFRAPGCSAVACEASRADGTRAAHAAQRTVRATAAWIATPEAGRTDTTAFVLVENGTMYDVFIVGAQTETAGSAELREMQASGTAAPLAEAPVPAFGQLEMSAKGVHIVLKDLKAPLKAGGLVTLVLALDSGERLTVSAAVK